MLSLEHWLVLALQSYNLQHIGVLQLSSVKVLTGSLWPCELPLYGGSALYIDVKQVASACLLAMPRCHVEPGTLLWEDY